MAVADFLNFSRAAEHLRLTQPAVSHQVRTLEDELGVALFRRTSKSVRLTQEGQLFLQYAGEILRTARISVTQVRQCRTSRPQKLGVGCRSAADLRLLRPALERLRREEPGVQPQLRRPGLRYLPLAEYPPLSYGAAWLGDSRAPALRRFLALLRDTL